MTHDQPRSEDTRTHGISKTAVWVAASRAIGAREPDSAVRNPDHLAEKLLGDPAELHLDHPIVDALNISYQDAMQNYEIADIVRAMIERTRFIDAALERAVAGGATQVLIPGAGLDSHAYRFQDQLAQVSVFEVDRAATLDFKRQRVEAALGGPPGNLTYVPIDFQRERLAAGLAQHGYDLSQRTFVILEGVTMYLPEDAARELFRFIAMHPPGSSVVFDYTTLAMVQSFAAIDLEKLPPSVRPSLERLMDMLADEPWFFGLPLGGEAEFLGELGLDLREQLTIGSEESVRRYLTRADGTIVGAEAHARSEALRKAAQAYGMEKMSPEEREAFQQRMQEQRRQMAYRIAEAAVARTEAA